MGHNAFQVTLNSLAEQYGTLDNQVERWAGHQQGLIGLFAEIEDALQSNFPADSKPVKTFEQGRDTYLDLLAGLAGYGQAAEIPTAFLNLRFFILLNAFLQACREALEKSTLNASLDAAKWVEKSYYAPYFFERLPVSRTEMTQMLEEEIAQLKAAPRDRSGIMLALQARKGVYATLAESYCPTHPMLYPLVQELDAIKASSDPDLVNRVETKLKEILTAI